MTGPIDLARAWVRRSRTKSPWLVHFDCGGCNGCDIEVLDTLTPRYSVERFGVINVGDPRQADVLVVTGPANRRNASVLRSVYEQMSEPKVVVAVGSCAAHGGIFRGSPNVLDGVGTVVPVDVFVAGCPPPPQRILAGIIEAAPRLAHVRRSRAATSGPGSASLVTQPPGDRPSIESDASHEDGVRPEDGVVLGTAGRPEDPVRLENDGRPEDGVRLENVAPPEPQADAAARAAR